MSRTAGHELHELRRVMYDVHARLAGIEQALQPTPLDERLKRLWRRVLQRWLARNRQEEEEDD